MFMNNKLKDNIVLSIERKLPYIHGVSREALMSAIQDGINEAVGETWSNMSLAERCGPSIWDFLSWIAKVADNEGKPDLYYNALELVQEGHPCKEVCRPHIAENLRIVNPMNYPTCFEHVHAFHNLVNKQIGKPQYPLYKATSRYDLDCDSCIFTPVGKSIPTQYSIPLKDNTSVRDAKRTIQNYTTKKVPYYGTTYWQNTGSTRVRNQNTPGIYQQYRSPAGY